jgi:nucleotide-binding universal stress UspA family protein
MRAKKGVAMYRTILWATDGSHEAEIALSEARRLLDPGGHLIAFHCDQRFGGSRVAGIPILADEFDRVQQIAEVVEDLRADGVHAELVVESTTKNVGAAITAAAGRGHVDAIVCGTRGLHGLVGFLSGSTAAAVARHASVPVIVVPVASPVHASTTSVEGVPV